MQGKNSVINTLLAIGHDLTVNGNNLNNIPTEKDHPHLKIFGNGRKDLPIAELVAYLKMNPGIKNIIFFMHGNVLQRNKPKESYKEIQPVLEVRKAAKAPINIYLASCHSGSIANDVKRYSQLFANTKVTAFSGSKRPTDTNKNNYIIRDTVRLIGKNPDIKPTEVIGKLIPDIAETITYCEVSGKGEYAALKYNSPKKNTAKNRDDLEAFQNPETLKEYLLNESIKPLHGVQDNAFKKLNGEIREHLITSIKDKETNKAEWHHKYLEAALDKASDNRKSDKKEYIMAADKSLTPDAIAAKKKAQMEALSKAIIDAASSGKLEEMIKRLIHDGSTPSQIKTGVGNAFMSACSNGKVEAIKALVEVGADPNGGVPNAIMVAASKGKVDAINALLDAGASLLPPKYSDSAVSLLKSYFERNSISMNEATITSMKKFISDLEAKEAAHAVHNTMFSKQNFVYIISKIDNQELSSNWIDTKNRSAANRYLVCTDPKKVNRNIFDKLITNANINYSDYKDRDLLEIALKKGHSDDTVGYLVDKMKEQGVFVEANYPLLEKKLQKRPDYLQDILAQGPRAAKIKPEKKKSERDDGSHAQQITEKRKSGSHEQSENKPKKVGGYKPTSNDERSKTITKSGSNER